MSRYQAVAHTQLLVLVGPKGAGKTTLARMLERQLGVRFLNVEAVAKRVLTERGGKVDEQYARVAFEAILRAIASEAEQHAALAIESTGASTEIGAFFEALRQRYDLRLIRVHATRNTCNERMAARDPTLQVQGSPALVRELYDRSTALSLPWDLELDNEQGLTAEGVAEAVRPLLRMH